METLTLAVQIAQLVVGIAVIVGLFSLFASRPLVKALKEQANAAGDQVRALKDQVAHLQNTTRAQTTWNILIYLEHDRLRRKRRTMYEIKENKVNYAEWTPEDKQVADDVCQSFNNVAILVEHKLFSEVILVSSYGPDMGECWRIAWPRIKELRYLYMRPDLWQELYRFAEKFLDDKTKTEVSEQQDQLRQNGKVTAQVP